MTADQLFQRLILTQSLAQIAVGGIGRLGGELPFQPLSKAIASARLLSSRSRHQLRRVHAGVEVGQIPFRQVTERRVGRMDGRALRRG